VKALLICILVCTTACSEISIPKSNNNELYSLTDGALAGENYKFNPSTDANLSYLFKKSVIDSSFYGSAKKVMVESEIG
jgi:hypothetical protein